MNLKCNILFIIMIKMVYTNIKCHL